MYSFPNLEPVHCAMSSSNCCFLTCIQISQKAGQVVWYSCIFKNFPQFVVIHTVKGFRIVNKAEVDVFLELSCFFCDPADVGSLISGCSVFLSHRDNHYCWHIVGWSSSIFCVCICVCLYILHKNEIKLPFPMSFLKSLKNYMHFHFCTMIWEISFLHLEFMNWVLWVLLLYKEK